MTEPVLWTAILITAGTCGAMAARALRLPAACGALIASFVLCSTLRGSDALAAWPDLSAIRAPLLALLCFLLGAEIDLTRLLSLKGRLLSGAAAQAVAVTILIAAGGVATGLEPAIAIVLGLAAMAASPAAAIAVVSEARSRGTLTQAVLALAPISVAIAAVGSAALSGEAKAVAGVALALPAGALCGGLIVMPLSRMSSRGAILAGAGTGALLLSGIAGRLPAPGAVLPLASIAAGFVVAHLIPDRDAIRDALRDVALPATIALFAIAGTDWLPLESMRIWIAGGLIVAGRYAGLAFGWTGDPGGVHGRLQAAAAMLPMSAVAALPALSGGRAGGAVGALLAAGFLSEAAGMTASLRSLRRAGEAVAGSEDPDAWRASMR